MKPEQRLRAFLELHADNILAIIGPRSIWPTGRCDCCALPPAHAVSIKRESGFCGQGKLD
jgi:hypothetical protein